MSNTILNALNAKEEKLQVKQDKAFDKMRDLEKKRDIEISTFVKNYFVGIETDLEDVVYEDSTSYMEISCKGKPYEKQVWNDKLDDYETITKYGRDRIATIYFDGDSWSSKEEDRFINMGMSTYSASDKYSQFQLNRFMYLGEVAKVIADFKDDILAGMNKIYEGKKKAIAKITEENSKLRSEIDKVQSDRENYKHDVIIRDLEKGITITSERLPYLQVRFDWGVGSIKGAKITRRSYSGKSFDLELLREGRRWNSETDEYENYTYDYPVEKVRKQKIIDAFVNEYSVSWDVQ